MGSVTQVRVMALLCTRLVRCHVAVAFIAHYCSVAGVERARLPHSPSVACVACRVMLTAPAAGGLPQLQ